MELVAFPFHWGKVIWGGSLLGVDLQRYDYFSREVCIQRALSEVCRFKQLNILDEEIMELSIKSSLLQF